MPDQSGYLTLFEAARHVPGCRSRTTLYRWCRYGSRVGSEVVKLKYVSLGHGLFTRPEWIEQFIADCTAASERSLEARKRRPERLRMPTHKEADARLKGMGL